MNKNPQFKAGKAYIKETVSAIYVAYVCVLDPDFINRPIGLCLRIEKNSQTKPPIKLKYDLLPMNTDWDTSREISVAQAKATMRLHLNDLSFSVGGINSWGHKMTKDIIHRLELFYQA